MTLRQTARNALLVVVLAVAPAAAQPAEYRAVLDGMVAAGLFDRAAGGDDAAASYFVREFVWRVNPTCDPAKPGALRKGGGKNIDGYAEDAIALNGNPADLRNVVDLVGGAGAPGARLVWGGPVQRRSSDVWECPKALGAREAAYIGLTPGTGGQQPGGGQQPQPTPVDLAPVLAKLDALAATVADLRAVLDEVRSTSANAAAESLHAATRASEIKTQIENLPATFQWPEYRGRVLGFAVTLRPQQ